MEDKTRLEEHLLSIDNLTKITATAVSSVDSFSEKQIVLTFSSGRIVVFGSGMKIANFSKQSGNFMATGRISGIKYLQKSDNLRQKLFK